MCDRISLSLSWDAEEATSFYFTGKFVPSWILSHPWRDRANLRLRFETQGCLQIGTDLFIEKHNAVIVKNRRNCWPELFRLWKMFVDFTVLKPRVIVFRNFIRLSFQINCECFDYNEAIRTRLFPTKVSEWTTVPHSLNVCRERVPSTRQCTPSTLADFTWVHVFPWFPFTKIVRNFFRSNWWVANSFGFSCFGVSYRIQLIWHGLDHPLQYRFLSRFASYICPLVNIDYCYATSRVSVNQDESE